MTKSRAIPVRRKFLIAAGLGGAGAVAAAVAGKQAVQALGEGAPDATRESSGYRVTDHIRKYYKTTQL